MGTHTEPKLTIPSYKSLVSDRDIIHRDYIQFLLRLTNNPTTSQLQQLKTNTISDLFVKHAADMYLIAYNIKAKKHNIWGDKFSISSESIYKLTKNKNTQYTNSIIFNSFFKVVLDTKHFNDYVTEDGVEINNHTYGYAIKRSLCENPRRMQRDEAITFLRASIARIMFPFIGKTKFLNYNILKTFLDHKVRKVPEVLKLSDFPDDEYIKIKMKRSFVTKKHTELVLKLNRLVYVAEVKGVKYLNKAIENNRNSQLELLKIKEHIFYTDCGEYLIVNRNAKNGREYSDLANLSKNTRKVLFGDLGAEIDTQNAFFQFLVVFLEQEDTLKDFPHIHYYAKNRNKLIEDDLEELRKNPYLGYGALTNHRKKVKHNVIRAICTRYEETGLFEYNFGDFSLVNKEFYKNLYHEITRIRKRYGKIEIKLALIEDKIMKNVENVSKPFCESFRIHDAIFLFSKDKSLKKIIKDYLKILR